MVRLLNPGGGGHHMGQAALIAWRWSFVLSLVAVVLIGCGTAVDVGTAPAATLTAFGVVFPKQRPQPGPQAYPAGLLEGKLVVDGPCLRVIADDGGTRYLLVWPPDYTLGTDHGTLIVLNGQGQMRYRVGEPASVGGGEVPDPSMWQQLPMLRQEPPKGCPGPYWLVSP